MDENTYGEDIVDQHWNIDGPHDAHTTRQAALALDRLVRFLNHATAPWHHQSAMPYAATANTVVQNLHSMVTRLPQLLSQLAQFLEHQNTDPTLYDDRRGGPNAPDVSTTALAACVALEQAAQSVSRLTRDLHNAAKHTTHLGNDEPVPTRPNLDGLDSEDLG